MTVDVADTVRSLVAANAGVDEVFDGDGLDALGMGDPEKILLLYELEAEFGVESILDIDLDWVTVADVVAAVERELAGWR